MTINYKNINTKEIESKLKEFGDNKIFYRYSNNFPEFFVTEGAKYLVESTDCFWILHNIAFNQENPQSHKILQDNQTQIWKYEANENYSIISVKNNQGEILYENCLDPSKRLYFPLQRMEVHVDRVLVEWELEKVVSVCRLPLETGTQKLMEQMSKRWIVERMRISSYLDSCKFG